MQNLTEKQRDILDFIEEFMDKNNMSPSVSEIAERFDIKISTAFAHLRALQRKKEISRSSNARSISIISRPRRMSGMVQIPLVGRVVAGVPVDNPAFHDGELWVCAGLGEPKTLFALKVSGESMRDLGIFDNDIVVVKQGGKLRAGDVVVALTNEGETTVKSYFPDKNKVQLRPANKDFAAKTYAKKDLSIQGKVVALHRYF